jgi:enoyl-CoA hydratase/carnithine racemase
MIAHHLEVKDDLGILHLRAGNANAMNDRVLAAVTTGLNEACAAHLKGLVLTGYGRFFSAGLDLIEIYEFDREQMHRFITHWENTMIALFAFPLPVVAAINGAAAAGGCIMAMACDYRVMADEAVMGMTGIRLGISLPAAALEILREVVPAANLARVLYSGQLFNAEEALALGLANQIAPREKLLDMALERLKEFTQHAGNPAAALKTALRQNTLKRLQQNHDDLREKFLDIWFSPPARQALAAARNALLAR